jgi:hypothetical protein
MATGALGLELGPIPDGRLLDSERAIAAIPGTGLSDKAPSIEASAGVGQTDRQLRSD